MLIRAVYRGVNYHEPVTPGKTTVDVQVFEPTDKPSAFSVTAHAIILQPDGSDLDVGEEYNITNKTQPPLAYYQADGSFVFSLPDGAQLNQVSAVGAAGMPVVQTTIDKGKNSSRPSPIRSAPATAACAVLQVPYPGNQANLTFSSRLRGRSSRRSLRRPRFRFRAMASLPAGQAQGFSVYMRDSVAANTPVHRLGFRHRAASRARTRTQAGWRR